MQNYNEYGLAGTPGLDNANKPGWNDSGRYPPLIGDLLDLLSVGDWRDGNDDDHTAYPPRAGYCCCCI
eukprot:12190069-Karenia_brevis.AAC.1